MLFQINADTHRLVDLSGQIIAPGTEDRPFRATRGFLADRAFKHDIATHTHVGAHIESPAHFYEGGRELADYPLEHFHGRGLLFDFSGVDGQAVTADALENGVGRIARPGDILLFRNTHPDFRVVQRSEPSRLPYLEASGARWIAARKFKMIVIDHNTGIRVANSVDTSRENHDILMRPGVEMPILEGADGLENLSRREFFFMALPFNVKGVDSAWTRAVAVEER